MNPWDIVLAAVIVLIVVLAIRKIHIDRKRGNGCLGCGGDCAGCSQSCSEKRKSVNG